MGEPPRLHEILLDWEQALVYFVTLCVKGRQHVLANDKTFHAIQLTVGEIRNWTVLAGVVMPDHVHLVVTPSEDRSLPVSDFSTAFKRMLRMTLGHQDWEWQR